MTMRRGEVYWANLDPVQGREQSGRRPVLVISSDEINRRPLVVTVVVGTKAANIDRDYPTNVRVLAKDSGLPLDTVFMCFQIRSLDPSRLEGPVTLLPAAIMRQIDLVIRRCLAL